ncbi:hypothetical protein, partial [Brevundimonas sp. TWP2-3-2]|uniref:hypothetical protein n=1 Tax=Brevundimonas sp. TWP2-3-2 TaxID=2804648 RepID=UPI003CE8FF36
RMIEVQEGRIVIRVGEIEPRKGVIDALVFKASRKLEAKVDRRSCGKFLTTSSRPSTFMLSMSKEAWMRLSSLKLSNRHAQAE